MASFNLYRKIDLHTIMQDYSIYFAQHALLDANFLSSIIPSNKVMIVTNKTVAALYLNNLLQALNDKACDVISLEDGEFFKNQDSVNIIYDALIEKKHHKDTQLIALGGGVIGDMTGFVASTYFRGVKFMQIPTTLLAQVDASIGGKTGINHPLGKNLIGSIYQPNAVVIDIETLKTLPAREFNAGFAEIIKYALLVGEDLYHLVEKVLNDGPRMIDSPNFIEVMVKCCQYKVDIVSQDERENGMRFLLNLGHTFAHALESITHYKRWLHGEAVGIGLYCAAVLSTIKGKLDKQWPLKIENLLKKAGLPHKIPKDLSLDEIRLSMSMDKKIKNNPLRFILVNEPGDCYVDDTVTEQELYQTLITAVGG